MNESAEEEAEGSGHNSAQAMKNNSSLFAVRAYYALGLEQRRAWDLVRIVAT